METKSSAQSLFKKFNFGSSSQKSRKNAYQAFLFLSNITGFLYFVPDILSRIVDYIFLSNSLQEFVSKINILPVLSTAHSPVTLIVSKSQNFPKETVFGNLKLVNLRLNLWIYVSKMKELIQEFQTKSNLVNDNNQLL